MPADRSKARFFARAAELLFTAKLDWSTGDWRCSLFDASWSPDFAGDVHVGDVPVEAIVASQPLVNRTVANGLLLADGVRFAALVHPETPTVGFFIWQADHAIEGQLLVLASTEVMGLPDTVDPGADYVLLFDVLNGIVGA
jgi:hypothetical protein